MRELLEKGPSPPGALPRGRVRAAAEEDIPRIAELHRRVFGAGTAVAPSELESYLLEIFCRHPWREEPLPSLVYEESDGEVVGCLGVMPRPMTIDGRPILGAVTHNFMVAPERRTTMAAVRMLKGLFSGAQDLTLAEGNGASRRVWEAVGGTTSLLHSIRWTRPLRPARYAISLLERRGLRRLYASSLRPFCDVADFAAARLPHSPLRQRPPGVASEELDVETLLSCLDRFSEGRSFRPRYDASSLQWLLRILARSPSRGVLRKRLVRKDGNIAGWYLYYVQPGGIGEVVQIGATEQSGHDVLDHLFHDAWREGVIAISGQLDPSLMPAFSEKFCLFHRGRGGSWVLIHSRNERIASALKLGDAFFTRLEGEWWIEL